MDIDDDGNLKIIEHKNGEPEETILSQTILKAIGIDKAAIHKNELKDVIRSIDKTMRSLMDDRNNLVKVKGHMKPFVMKDGEMVKNEILLQQQELIDKIDSQIRDLDTVKENLLNKYGMQHSRQAVQSGKLAMQQMKSSTEEVGADLGRTFK